MFPKDHIRVHLASEGGKRAYQSDLSTGQPGNMIDIDDPVRHPAKMDMQPAAVSSASPRVPSRARQSSVAPSSAESAALDLERAATVLSRRRSMASPRVRGSDCHPPSRSKRSTAISLTSRRAPTDPAPEVLDRQSPGCAAIVGPDGELPRVGSDQTPIVEDRVFVGVVVGTGAHQGGREIRLAAPGVAGDHEGPSVHRDAAGMDEDAAPGTLGDPQFEIRDDSFRCRDDALMGADDLVFHHGIPAPSREISDRPASFGGRQTDTVLRGEPLFRGLQRWLRTLNRNRPAVCPQEQCWQQLKPLRLGPDGFLAVYRTSVDETLA